MKWSGNLPVVVATEMVLPVVKTTTQPKMVWKPTVKTTNQRRNLYMKWSGNLPVVKTTTQPTATESLHEMVWKLTS